MRNVVSAVFPTGPAGSEGGVTTSTDSVWLITDKDGSLARIDPDTGTVLQTVRVPAGSYNPRFYEGRVWVTRADGAEIKRQNFILYTRASYLSGMIEEYFRKEDIVLSSTIELGNMEAIKELVKLGLGISILAPWVARKELAEGSLRAVPLGRRKLRRSWGILLRKGRPLTLAQETFIGLCKSVAESFGDPAPVR